MTALEVKDFGNQLEVLLERYETTTSEKAKEVLEDCIAVNLGCMEDLVQREDMTQSEYNHYRVLVTLVTAKAIKPKLREETYEEREKRVIEDVLDRYAEKYNKTKFLKEKNKITAEVCATLNLLITDVEKQRRYWDYYDRLRKNV